MDHWLHGSVGLSQATFHTAPEPIPARLPLHDARTDITLILDGRLDNRTELLSCLSADGPAESETTDAELVLAAYLMWQDDCPAHLVGEFTFVLWDGRRRALFCARDHMGLRPFYYFADDRLFVFGSSLAAVLCHPAVPMQPNEGMVAEYLSDAVTSDEHTLFHGLCRLPPAHSLLVTSDRVRMSRYWHLPVGEELRYASEQRYAEEFLALFQEAVRCRLHSSVRIGSELSGGLDSSSVVGMASLLIQQGQVDTAGFETFSLVFPGQDCDESRYSRDVVRLWNGRGNTAQAVVPSWEGLRCQIQRHADIPDCPNLTMHEGLYARARAKGFRVLLTGLGGDDWLGESFSLLPDWWARGQYANVASVFWQHAKKGRLWGSLKDMLGELSPGLRHTYRVLLRRNVPPSWVPKAFAARCHLRDRLRGGGQPERRFASYAQRDIFRGATCGEQTHAYEMIERSCTDLGIEVRHPFNDRRLVEFLFRLPPEQRYDGPFNKLLLRRAMGQRLPDSVRSRTDKADFSHTTPEALKAIGSDKLVRHMAIEELGWLNGECFRRIHDEHLRLYAQGDPRYKAHLGPVWLVLALELWYRAVFLDRCADTGQPPALNVAHPRATHAPTPSAHAR